MALGVGESRIIDLSEEQEAGRLPRDLHHGSLQLVPAIDSDRIVAELFNFSDRGGGYVVGSTFTSYPNRGTSSVWRIDGTFQTTVMVENTADQDDQVSLKLFSEQGAYEKTFAVPAGGLLKINVRDLQQNSVPDKDGHLLLGTSGILSLAGSHNARSKLSYDKIIHSADEAEYVGLLQNPCDYVTSIGIFVDFSGGQNPFPVMFNYDWSQSGTTFESASGTSASNSSLVQISNNGSGDMAIITPRDGQSHEVSFTHPPMMATGCTVCSNETFNPSGGVTVPPKLTITGISPGKGLVGVTTSSVTISGTGLTGATVMAPSGITSTVKSSNNTTLVVDLAVASNATTGNNSLTVSAATEPAQQASVNFFVQVPTSLNVLSSQVISMSSYCPDPLKTYGILIAIHYQVLDQNSASITSSAMEPQEKSTNMIINGVNQGDPRPNWIDVGPSAYPGTSKVTDTNGQYWDAPFGFCNAGAITLTFTQPVSILVNANRYPTGGGAVRTNNWSGQSSSSGHGSITNATGVSQSH